MRVIYGPYEPDKPQFLQDGLSDVSNVYPAANGYRPVGAFSPITQSLPASFYGGASYVSSDGTGTLLGGTNANLYRYDGTAWVALMTSPTIPARWQFTQFGDLAIAVNGGVTQKVDLLANTVAPVPGAPTAHSVATVRDFVVYGQANGNAAMVQWSAFNNQDGNTLGVDQCGNQPMLTGGFVMGIVGGEYGLIIQRSRVVRMTYTGDPDVPFQFDEISANIGAISSYSIVQAGRMVFFLSDRGFMVCDGNEVKPIGLERVDATFFKQFPRATLSQMYAAVDPRRNTVAWSMPGSPGLILLYDWALDKWSPIRMMAGAIMSGFSTNASLDALDVLYPDGIDSIPYSLDDERFAGGDPLFLVINNDHAMGVLSGANISASFQTVLTEYAQGAVSRLRSVRPICDATAGIEVMFDARGRLGDPPTARAFTDLRPSGSMPVRASGRFISTRMTIAAGVPWSYVQGLDIEAVAGGTR